MDIDKAKENVEKASGFFETLNQFIKKHPIWTVIIAIVALSELGYLSFLGLQDEDVEPIEEQYYEEAEFDDADSSDYHVEQLQTAEE